MGIKFTECEEQVNKFAFTYELTIDNVLFELEGEMCPRFDGRKIEHFVNISDFTINGNLSLDDYYEEIEEEIINQFDKFQINK